jgi:hypothetical protein
MDIPTLVIGSLGIAATIVVGAFGFASSPGEFWLARSLFFASALLLAGTVFAVQWIVDRPTTSPWMVGIGIIGFVIFIGLAASVDWINRKEAAFAQDTKTLQKAPIGARHPEPGATASHDTPSMPPPTSQPTAGSTNPQSDVAKTEDKKILAPPIATFRDGRAHVGFSMNYHVEPSDAPLAVLTFGEINRVPEVLNSKVTSVVLAVLEPLSLTEARSRRPELEREIKERLRVELKKMGITIDGISLTEIEPI